MRTISLAIVSLWTIAAASPATAQFHLKQYDYASASAEENELSLMQPLAETSEVEQSAGLVWTLRAALNVAALQCQFEPTLHTDSTYNALLIDHARELSSAWSILNRYFVRLNKSTAAGQAALDRFGTRTYSSFATVSSQLGFCRTAAAIGRDVLFSDRGSLAVIARTRLRELRNSLIPQGEQQFPRFLPASDASLPRLDQACWSRKGTWQKRKCGAFTLSAPSTSEALP